MNDMEKRKVAVITERYFYKKAVVEIEVPVNIQEEDLVNYLLASDELKQKTEESLSKSSPVEDDEKNYFKDPLDGMRTVGY